MSESIEDMADQLTKAMGDYVARALSSIKKEVDGLRAQIAAMPVAKDGTNGKDGIDGAPGPMGAAGPAGEKGDAGERGERGEQGLQGAPGADGAAGPIGPIGMQGEKGADAVNGKDGVDGKDGVSVDEEQVRGMVDAVVSKAIDAMPKPRDGQDAISIPGTDGQDGEPGPAGRDALQIDILPAIDPTKSYARGTYARYRGGIARADRNTIPGEFAKSGWEVVIDGVAEIGIEQGDDIRSIAIGVETSSGQTFVKTMALPVMLDAGVYEADRSYRKGDVTNWDGSMFVAQRDIEKSDAGPKQPDWRLIVKRGRDGADADDKKARSTEPLRLR